MDTGQFKFLEVVDKTSHAKMQKIEARLKTARDLLKEADLDARITFVKMLQNPANQEAIEDQPEVLHKILVQAAADGWIHYSRLAKGMKYTPTNVHRYFLPKSHHRQARPTRHAIPIAMKVLAQLIEKDIALIKKGKAPEANQPLKRDPARRGGTALLKQTKQGRTPEPVPVSEAVAETKAGTRKRKKQAEPA